MNARLFPDAYCHNGTGYALVMAEHIVHGDHYVGVTLMKEGRNMDLVLDRATALELAEWLKGLVSAMPEPKEKK